MTDRELLTEYRQTGSQAAFAELVARHLDLVYSVARRQVRSAHLAEEVAQSVFLDLAGDAVKGPAGVEVVAWLHVVARRTAIDLVRREVRRSNRERESAELAAMNPPPADWLTIEPLIDEAIEKLKPADRTAVLMRFFEEKSFRDVGHALGVSEDAAQKRVSRAIDELRTFLTQRGVATTAAGLAAALPAYGMTSAPTTLATTITTAAFAAKASVAGATAEVTRTIAMTTFQKVALTGTLVIALGAGTYQTAAAWSTRAEIDRVSRQIEDQLAEARQLNTARVSTERALSTAEGELDDRLAAVRHPVTPADAALIEQMNTWLSRLDTLYAMASEHPELAPPELNLLRDADWFSVASGFAMDTDEQKRNALLQLRIRATQTMVSRLWAAVSAYQRDHHAFPRSASDLAGVGDDPLPTEILELYQVVPWKKSTAIVRRAPVDPLHDSFGWVGATVSGTMSASAAAISIATSAYTKAHGNQPPATLDDVMPYLPWAGDRPVLERMFKAQGSW